MKNLKKVLSLVLVFAMALGLMMSASATTLSDWDDIKNQEAVQLLDSLQIMSGRADGSFDPDGFLTRAEVAKMIYVARTGGVDDKAVLYTGSSNVFTDTKGWAEGYINYAAAKGFVSGRGNGKFDPSATITGFELLKITLGALGYNAKLEGLAGTSWKANVAALAQEAGLTYGYVGDPNMPITRDEAAGVFQNLIYAETIKYSDGIAGGSGKIFGTAYLNLKEYKGVLVANEYAGLNESVTTKGTCKLAEATNTDDAFDTSKVIPATAANSLLGHNVTALVREVNSKITKVYSIVETVGMNNVMTMSPLYDANTSTTWETGAVTFTNYALTPDGADGDSLPGNDIANTAGNGNKYFAIDNDNDSKYEYEIMIKYTFAKVGTVGTDYKYIGTTKVEAAKAVEGYADIAKGDYVVYYTANGFYYIDKVASITGKLTSYKASDYAIVEGVQYKQSAIAGTTYDLSNQDAALNVSQTYLTYNGSIIKSIGAEVTPDLAYVLAFQDGIVDQVKVVRSSGETAVYNVSATSPITPSANNLYGYYFSADGSINFYAAGYTSTSADLASDYKKGSNNLNSYVVDADSIVFFQTSTGAWVIYKGIGNIPSLDYAQNATATYTYFYESDALLGNVLKAAVVTGYGDITSSATNYFVVTSAPATIKIGTTTFKTFKAFDGTEEKTYTAVNSVSVNIGDIYTFTFAGDYVSVATPAAGASGIVRYVDNNNIALTHGNIGSTSSADTYVVTSTTKYYVIDNTYAAYGITSAAAAEAGDASVYPSELIDSLNPDDYNVVLFTNTYAYGYETVSYVFIYKVVK